MATQITIDGINVGGTGGRTIYGQINNTFDSSGIRVLSCSIMIEGSSASDLQDKWETAKAAFIKKDKRITITLDSSVTNYFEDIFPGDGRTQSCFSYIGMDPDEISTATNLYCTLTIAAQQSEITPPATTSPSNPNKLPQFKGQIGSYKLTTLLNEARIESRALLINIGTVYNKSAYGPFNITSVESAGGKARFILDSVGGITTFTDDMKLYVSGTTNYNGTHIITAIDVGTKKITTDTTWTGTDTGTVLIGEATRPEDVYTEIRSSLLSLIGIDSDGSRNSTTGLVLSGETSDRTNEGIVFLLSSEWVQKDYNDAIRNFQLGIEVTEVPEWNEEAGIKPVLINAVVVFGVDKDVAGTDNPYTMWNTIRGAVITDIKSQISEGTAEGPWTESIKHDKKTGQVEVAMGFIARNTDVVSYKKVTQTQEELDFTTWRDSEGYDHIQMPPGAKPKIVTVSVERVGRNPGGISITPPQESGYTFIEITEQLGIEGPITRRNFNGQYWVETLTKVYRRFNLRSGNDPRVRGPITG